MADEEGKVKEPPSLDKLVKTYLKIREKREELAKEDAKCKEKLDMLCDAMLEWCKATGASTMRTPYGTVSKRVSRRYWTNNWEAFVDFANNHKASALIQQRINSTSMKQFLDENPDVLPPGLNVEASEVVSILKNRS